MIKKEFEIKRETKTVALQPDFAVIGGGLAGVCAAITAARSGIKVVLAQDRPVLGGNASSEVRLWALGATSHMGNNNRWSREGGLINEILLDNLKRNKEGNPLLFDTILLEKVYEEENITLLLNTSVYEVQKSSDRKIASVAGFCSQNSTTYTINAPLFCDASGDGLVAFLAGASFRMGAEDKDEFEEGFAPNVEDYGNLLGHSLYFYTKDVGKPVSYTAPSFAIKNAAELPRIVNYELGNHGCQLWWVEYGGRLDTVHQSEEIKFELWKVVYGIWDHVKNSGKYPEAGNLTLEWVGAIPGKRESRRFEGDYILSQKDIVEQRDQYDAVSYGGWAMDLHPADGVYSEHNSCTQWHSKGVYTIPYRCYYSKDIDNLFLAGRIMSASHVAFGSSRVMLTCAHGAQAVGEAAALALRQDCCPREIGSKENIKQLQTILNRNGQGIPRIEHFDEKDIAKKAKISASSTLLFVGFDKGAEWQVLEFSTAQLVPLRANSRHRFTFEIDASEDTIFHIELKTSDLCHHFTPDRTVETQEFKVSKGMQKVTFKMNKPLQVDHYAYICLMRNEAIRVLLSEERVSGIMTVQNKVNKSVSNFGKQEPPEDIGIDSFEFWTPERRPKGKNLAMQVTPALSIFDVDYLTNGELRPTSNGFTNAWAAAKNEERPEVIFAWDAPQKINIIRFAFDCDYDHALESTLMGHHEDTIPFVIGDYAILNGDGTLLMKVTENHQAINTVRLDQTIETDKLIFKFNRNTDDIPVSVFKISVF